MVRVRLLGIPAVFDGVGKEVRLRSRKQLGVLVYLVVDGRDRPVSRDVLMEAFWPNVPRDRAYHSLCQAVTHIRGLLGPDSVRRRGEGLQLVAPVETDIGLLAAEHERGDLTHPLREADLWGGVEFGHWVERSRERCRRLAEIALRDGIALHRRAGATLRVHRCAELLYELDPLSEPAVLALAERELLQGDVVGAIRLLRVHLARLGEQLGCQPQPAPERLLRRLEAGAHPPVELVPKRLAAHAARVRPMVLVAREREMSHLEAEWQRVHEERSLRAHVFTGPGGIGKTSLIRRFAATVAARAETALVVSCQEMGEGIPFAALADLVAALLRDPSVSGTDPLWLAEISRIQPGVRQQYPGVPAPPEAPPETIRVRIAEGIARMIAATTDGAPLAILVDDLHYMDPATRDVLAVLCRRAQDLPLLLIGTVRSIGVEGGLVGGPLGKESVPWTSSRRLESLGVEGTRALLLALAPSLQLDAPQVVRRIIDLSDGNPQFAEMLLADWQQYATASLAAGRAADELPTDWQPPESLRQAFARLYHGLDETCQQLLHVLAVAQRALSPEEVARAIGKGLESIDSAALELLTRGILRLDQGTLCLKNDLHGAVVYYALPRQVQQYHHRKWGRFLLESSSGDQTHPQLEAARHFTLAGDFRAARKLIHRHALSAIEGGAPIETERVIRAFLLQQPDCPSDPHIRLLLAQSLTGQGRYGEALDELDQVENHPALELHDRALLSTLRALCLQRTRLLSEQSVLAECRRALSLAEQADSEALTVIASQVTVEAASEALDDSLIRETIARLRLLAKDAASTTTKARAMTTEAFCLMESGDFSGALEAFRHASDALREEHLDVELARSLNGQGICAMAVGQHKAALQSFRESILVADKLQDADHKIAVLGNMGSAHEEIGAFNDATNRYADAAALAGRSANPRRSALAYANAAHIAIVNQDLTAAADFLVLARSAANDSQLQQLSSLVTFTEADLCLALKEPERAWRVIQSSVGIGKGRLRAIDNNGKSTRLTLHCLYATRGVEAVATRVDEVREDLSYFRLSDRLEVSTFLVWLGSIAGLTIVDADQLRREMDALGLVGVLGILRAVGTAPW